MKALTIERLKMLIFELEKEIEDLYQLIFKEGLKLRSTDNNQSFETEINGVNLHLLSTKGNIDPSLNTSVLITLKVSLVSSIDRFIELIAPFSAISSQSFTSSDPTNIHFVKESYYVDNENDLRISINESLKAGLIFIVKSTKYGNYRNWHFRGSGNETYAELTFSNLFDVLTSSSYLIRSFIFEAMFWVGQNQKLGFV